MSAFNMTTKPTKIIRALSRNQQIINNHAEMVYNSAISDLVGRGYHQAQKTANTYHTQMWSEVGYPKGVDFDNLYNMFSRNGFAYGGIMMPVEYGWSDYPAISDSEDKNADESEFEKQTKSIFKSQKLFKRLRGADWRNRIGEYSAFIIQVRGDADQSNWAKPLDQIRTDQIVRFIPVNQGQLIPASFYPNTDENYPNPSSYTFQESNNNDKQTAGSSSTIDRSFQVHASRVIIFAEGADDDTIHGRPTNLAGFNALLNLEKINASGSEGFWQAVKDNYIAKLGAVGKSLTATEKNDITKRFDDLSAGLHKAAVVGNWEVDRINKPLPGNYKDVLMNPLFEYCASVNIPVAVLIGQITGVLAGDKDNMQFNDMINSRREHWQNEMIELTIRWMDKYCTDYTAPEDIFIEWPDMNEQSFASKVEVVDKLANAIQKLINSMVASGGELPVTIDEIRDYLEMDALEVDIDTVSDRDKNNESMDDE